jgi:outer membrane protein assembly factor BamB
LLVLVLPLVAVSPTAEGVVDPEVFRSGCGRFHSLVSQDIDGDGAHEVLFGTYEGYVVQLQYRAGDFFLEWESPQHGERCWGLAVGDIDLDGVNEIVVGDGEGDLFVYDAESHDLEWKRLGQMVRDAHGIVIADLEEDGRIEIVVGTGYKTDQDWGTIYVWAGDGSSEKPLRSYGPYDSRLRGMGVADLDGDGELELAFGSGVNLGDIEGKGYLRVLDAATGELEWQSEDLEGDVEGLVIVDTDLDERPNIIVGEGYRYREGRVHIFQYDPDTGGYAELWTSDNIGPKAWGVAVGDCDADGAMEIIVGNQPGYIYIFDATTHALEWKSELLGTDIFGMVLDDVDDDGRIEIVASQGGYQGKGDFTSGYSEPHIYVIDGTTHEFEHVLGERDIMGTILVAALILLILVALLEVGVLTKRYRRRRAAVKDEERKETEGEVGGLATPARTPGESGIPGWGLDLGEDEEQEDITRPPGQEGEEGGGP